MLAAPRVGVGLNKLEFMRFGIFRDIGVRARAHARARACAYAREVRTLTLVWSNSMTATSLVVYIILIHEMEILGLAGKINFREISLCRVLVLVTGFSRWNSRVGRYEAQIDR